MPRKKTPEEYYNLCKEKGLDLPIEDYVNNKTKIRFKCSKGHIYFQRPDHHLNNHGCKLCATIKLSNKRRKAAKEYIQECKEKCLDLPIESYVNNRTKIKHKCKKCNNIYLQKPSNHLSGHGCPKCATDNLANIRRKSQERYIEECTSKGIDLPIDEYQGVHIRIKHKCSKCGSVYEQSHDDHLHNKGCPICSQSHGEKFIQNYLDKHNIKYEPQKKFKDLKDKNLLSYDFYLPKQKLLIEYQGIQHFIRRGKGLFSNDYFPTQQYHDKLKRDYASKNGYSLLEPTYGLDTQEKINNYLDKHLKGLL